MYDGSIKPVETVVIGDLLMGDDSTPRKVLTLARGREAMYNVKSEGETQYTVNESHILSLKFQAGDGVLDISVKDYLSLPKKEKDQLFGYRVPIYFQHQDIGDEDPYQIGYNSGGDIPMKYKCNSVEIRVKVLSGILDKMAETKDLNNDDDMIYLARSLGFSTKKRKKATNLGSPTDQNTPSHWNPRELTNITGSKLTEIVDLYWAIFR